MKNLKKLCLGIATLGLLVGCGSADEAAERVGAAAFHSTVASPTELGAFTPEQSAQFCNELADWELAQAQADLPNACRGMAWFSTQLFADPSLSLSDIKQSCQSSFDSCMAGESLMRRECGKAAAYPTTCHATVAEAEACSNDMIADWKRENAAAPACSDLMSSDLTAGVSSNETNLSAACVAVLSKCPSYFDAE